MLDIATAFNKYAFLGSEFLTWLWWASEHDQDTILENGKTVISIGKGIVIVDDGKSNRPKLKISITGTDAGYKEAIMALRGGGSIKEINFNCSIGDNEFSFTIKSDDLSLKGLKTPSIESPRGSDEDEIEGAVLEKIYLDQVIFECLDGLFVHFINSRLSGDWTYTVLPAMRLWINEA